MLAIGAGLALGREGPTVQMGAAIGTAVARRIVRDPMEENVVEAAGAGAGLAVAFNAPIGGAVFVFEELTARFAPHLVMATLCAGAMAVAVMRGMLGDVPDFFAGLPESQMVTELPTYLAFGAALGVVGVLYNTLTMGFLQVTDRLRRVNSVARAAVIGAVIGLIGWYAPTLVGGGEIWTQTLLSGSIRLDAIALYFLARMAIAPLCYAAGTPGGLFAPLLGVGAAFGALFAGLADAALPGFGLSQVGFAVVGMAGAVHRDRARTDDRRGDDDGNDRARRSGAADADRLLRRDPGHHPDRAAPRSMTACVNACWPIPPHDRASRRELAKLSSGGLNRRLRSHARTERSWRFLNSLSSCRCSTRPRWCASCTGVLPP